MKNDFVHLHLHSQYSLLDGAIKFDELFEEVSKQGMSAVALTDHGNLFGAYDFYKLGKKNNVKPIIGCEVYITKDRTKKTPENIPKKKPIKISADKLRRNLPINYPLSKK